MNIKDYIASGILEMYVLGEVSPAEARQVEAYALEYPEIAEELRAVQDALLDFNESKTPIPSTGLEQKILNSIPDTVKPPINGKANGPDFGRFLLPGLLLISLVALAYFFQQNRNNLKLLEEEREKFEQLQTNCDSLQQKSNEQMRYIAIVGDEGNEPVFMAGLEIAPESMALVHYNREKENSYLEIKNLPAAPAGKQYQLWAIVDGQPTDMGVFDIAPGALALTEVPFIENPQAFAVTLENVGGSPTPSLDQMYMIGNI